MNAVQAIACWLYESFASKLTTVIIYSMSKHILKAYKFRLYPNPEQQEFFAKSFGCARFIWNKMLNDKIEHYEKTKTTLKNTPAQYKGEFEWLKEVDSLALANVQLDLQKAFQSFFKSRFGF
ncbi:MAG TPA: helix-turn-helix domain-containing protein, partial [Thiopseudomonas sp.]|nr:helix-turn-helix domain-containing protein [Thiopseudomonas sp.]